MCQKEEGQFRWSEKEEVQLLVGKREWAMAAMVVLPQL
jgi:hypothetical protein